MVSDLKLPGFGYAGPWMGQFWNANAVGTDKRRREMDLNAMMGTREREINYDADDGDAIAVDDEGAFKAWKGAD